MRSKQLDKNIAKNLITLRRTLGLSQRKFALKAGIDQAHMNKIERGHMSVSLSNLQKISDTYGVPIKVFFDFTAREGMTETEKQILQLVTCVEEEWKQKLLLSILKELKDARPSE